MKRAVVLHPFFFSIYSVLGVYSLNSLEVPVQWVIRPLIIAVILITLIFYALKYVLIDTQYAGLITTFTLFWLFFGHFHRSLFEKSSFWNTIFGTLLALVIWTIPLVLLGSRWAWKKIRNHNLITSFLNITSIVVVLLPIYTAGNYWIQSTRQANNYNDQKMFESQVSLKPQSSYPDIYLIILDAYGRDDVLRDVYGFDNSQFVGYLKQKGFYIADQSMPNYPQTVLSLSSLLNMQYLDGLTKDFQDTGSRGPLNNLVQQSCVRHLLHDTGYKFVALPSASLSTQMRDADVYYGMTAGNLNEFEGLLLSSTIANLAINAWNLNIPVPSYDLHRRYILFSLEKLETMGEVAGPKFVFVHIMAPHPPFVLDGVGNPIEPIRPFNSGDASAFMGPPEEYIDGYVNEIQYLNRRLADAIGDILAQSKQPPIIVIQGDHGSGNYFNLVALDSSCPKERYSILNAYYFPDQNYEALYPTITPVNSFRVIFNQYFGGNLKILDDKNYYASWYTPYVYSDVSGQVQSCDIKFQD